MSKKPNIPALARLGMTVAFILAVAAVSAQSGPAEAAAGKTADEVYKNIKVLKGVPADQLIPAMQFITASLGVECDFCHEQGAFEKDDKKPKETARKMMQMMFAINQENFDTHREVTCYSCHRGARKPVTIPLIGEEEPKPAPTEAEETNPPEQPAAVQILEKYISAIGGAEAIQRISSRVRKGTVSFGSRQFPIEIFSQAPDKRTSVMHLPNGDSTTTYNGHSGWLGVPGRPVHEMTGSELEAAQLDASLDFPVHLRQALSDDLKVKSADRVGDRPVNVVWWPGHGDPAVGLYFDEQSGLLLRLLRYAESPLGRSPTQIDYSDYRETQGVKVPFRWTIARPGGRFTIQVQEMQQNVPIPATKFDRPAVASALEQKPPSK